MLEDSINALSKSLEILRSVLGDGHHRTKDLMTALRTERTGLAMKAQGDPSCRWLFSEGLDINRLQSFAVYLLRH